MGADRSLDDVSGDRGFHHFSVTNTLSYAFSVLIDIDPYLRVIQILTPSWLPMRIILDVQNAIRHFGRLTSRVLCGMHALFFVARFRYDC
jgi:hypothetical protein